MKLQKRMQDGGYHLSTMIWVYVKLRRLPWPVDIWLCTKVKKKVGRKTIATEKLFITTQHALYEKKKIKKKLLLYLSCVQKLGILWSGKALPEKSSDITSNGLKIPPTEKSENN